MAPKAKRNMSAFDVTMFNNDTMDKMLADKYDKWQGFRVYDGLFRLLRPIHRSFNWH